MILITIKLYFDSGQHGDIVRLWLFETPNVTWAEQSCGRQQGVLRLRHLQRGHAVEEVDHWTQQILTASCSQTMKEE